MGRLGGDPLAAKGSDAIDWLDPRHIYNRFYKGPY